MGGGRYWDMLVSDCGLQSTGLKLLPNGGFCECRNNDSIKRGYFLSACVTVHISGNVQ
jgi:hypothetical protein